MPKTFELNVTYSTDKIITEATVVCKLMRALKRGDDNGWVVVAPACEPSLDLAEVEKEAEKLLPTPDDLRRHGTNNIRHFQDGLKVGYISAAKSYINRIRELEGEVVDLKKKLADCAHDYNTLYDQAQAWKEESGN